MVVQQENYSSACCIPHTLLSVDLRGFHSWSSPILRASSVTQQQLCSEGDAEHTTFLCSNTQPHAQTSTLSSLGNGPSGILLSCSFSQTSVPGVMKGHAGHLSHGRNGYSLVWQKPQDFQLNSFQVKLINLCNTKICVIPQSAWHHFIQPSREGNRWCGKRTCVLVLLQHAWLPGAGDSCVGSCWPCQGWGWPLWQWQLRQGLATTASYGKYPFS